MQKYIDVTGLIQDGMWNYEPPFPSISIKPLPPVPWVEQPVYCEIFEGMHSQTGTYLETPAHFYGMDSEESYLLADVELERIMEVPCVVLNLGLLEKSPDGSRHGITVNELESCLNAKDICEGDAILVGTGWGRYWMDPDYLNTSPYFTKAAMDWLISKKPSILGSDLGRWENLDKPEGFFPDFYAADILMVGPLVNLEKVTSHRCRLTALPLNIARTSCAPARVVIIQE
jgi:arylformamidase